MCPRLRVLHVVALLLLVLAAACEDGGEVASGDVGSGPARGGSAELETVPLPGPTATPSVPPRPRPTDPPPARSVTITAPADGDSVSTPVTLEVRVEGFTLAPIDGSFEQRSGHLYAYVDTPLPTEQVRIPEDPSIVRFSEPQISLPDLDPGEHTVRVIAAHGYPVPMMPIVSDEVTFTVR